MSEELERAYLAKEGCRDAPLMLGPRAPAIRLDYIYQVVFSTLGSVRIGEHAEIWGVQALSRTPDRTRKIRRRSRVRRRN